MKKFSYICVLAVILSTVFLSCDDMLNADSDRSTTDNEYTLDAAGDSVYSMFGILSQLQKLADSYVLLGELRGDLMDITDKSDLSLREINNFDISSNNKYVDIKNYYSVINNCNYILSKLDTNMVDKGQKFKLRQYAAIKTIRAWTFLQVALNFKTVKYYENPILTIADAEKQYAEYDLLQLINVLIPQLEPLKSVENPNLGYIETYNTKFSYFPVRILLGDLYMWKASITDNSYLDYEKAAILYREYMFNNRISIDKKFTSYWIPVNNTISSNAYIDWVSSFDLNSTEVITTITCPTEYGQDFYLDTLNNQSLIAPSAISLSNWDSQTYYLNEASNAQGDLRKFGSIWFKESVTNPTSSNSYQGEAGASLYIYKYKIYNQNIIIYRAALLYLRYAEAVNRMNKPQLAFAVLKYGLNSTNMNNIKIIPAKEKDSPVKEYMNFNDMRFRENVGIRMRGLGSTENDTTFYKIPKLSSLADSVLYVEDLIQKELALETAFEGNRFHDLMRFAIRRNDNAYLADKVAAKNPSNQPAIKAKLMDKENWYIRK